MAQRAPHSTACISCPPVMRTPLGQQRSALRRCICFGALFLRRCCCFAAVRRVTELVAVASSSSGSNSSSATMRILIIIFNFIMMFIYRVVSGWVGWRFREGFGCRLFTQFCRVQCIISHAGRKLAVGASLRCCAYEQYTASDSKND